VRRVLVVEVVVAAAAVVVVVAVDCPWQEEYRLAQKVSIEVYRKGVVAERGRFGKGTKLVIAGVVIEHEMSAVPTTNLPC
jgi:hypothetical protein